MSDKEKIVYRVESPEELVNMPEFHALPEGVDQAHPALFYLQKGHLLAIIEDNLTWLDRNATMLDKTPEDTADTAAKRRCFQAFRAWVSRHPNDFVFVGMFPGKEFDVLEEP